MTGTTIGPAANGQTARGKAASGGRLLAIGAGLVLVVLAATACSDGDAGSPAPPPAGPGGLAILAGEPGRASLTVLDEDGSERDVELPDPDAAWLSVSAGGRFLVSFGDGRLMRSSVHGRGDGPTWAEVRGAEPTRPVPTKLSFAVWALDGGRLVALDADFTSGGTFNVVVIDPATRGGLVLPIERPPAAAPPAWLDESRVAVPTLEGPDRIPGFSVLDTATGDVSPTRLEGVGFAATAARGSAVALREGDRIVVQDAPAAVLQADRTAPPSTEVPLGDRADGSAPGVFALDPPGNRLAIVWLAADGTAAEIRIHDRAAGWRQTARVPIPKSGTRAVVGWVP
jgi:hypothetical protein